MITPHGGQLVDRVHKGDFDMGGMPSIPVSKEIYEEGANIATGVFSPLEGFLTKNDYDSVVNQMRLTSDVAWTIPIVFDVNDDDLHGLKEGDDVLLTHGDGALLLSMEELYSYDKKDTAQKVYGTLDEGHPGVVKTQGLKDKLVGGKIKMVKKLGTPFDKYALSPVETRTLFKEKGWKKVTAFQTRNVPHIGHEYVQKAALTVVDGLFINPLIGKKKPGDFRDDVILESYEALIQNYYPASRAVMSILQTEMRYAGPKEAIHHSIMRKNFGCTHFIVGRDHAGVGSYYAPFAAHEIFDDFPDLDIEPIFFRAFSYCKKCGSVVNDKICPHDDAHINFSGTKIRGMLAEGKEPDEMFMRPEVSKVIIKYDEPFVK